LDLNREEQSWFYDGIDVPIIGNFKPSEQSVGPVTLTYKFGKKSDLNLIVNPFFSMSIGGDTKFEFSASEKFKEHEVGVHYIKYDQSTKKSSFSVYIIVNIKALLEDILGRFAFIEIPSKPTKFTYNITKKELTCDDLFPTDYALAKSLKLTDCTFHVKLNPLSIGIGAKLVMNTWKENDTITLDASLDFTKEGIVGKATLRLEDGISFGAHLQITEVTLSFAVEDVGGECKFMIYNSADNVGDLAVHINLETLVIDKFTFIYPDQLSIKDVVNVFLGGNDIANEVLELVSYVKFKGIPQKDLEEERQIVDQASITKEDGHEKRYKQQIKKLTEEQKKKTSDPPLLISFDVPEGKFEVDVECSIELFGQKEIFGQSISGFVTGSLSVSKGFKFDGYIKPIIYKVLGTTILAISNTKDEHEGAALEINLDIGDLTKCSFFLNAKVTFILFDYELNINISKTGIHFFIEAGLFNEPFFTATVDIIWKENALYAIATMNTDKFLENIAKKMKDGLTSYGKTVSEKIREADETLEEAKTKFRTWCDEYDKLVEQINKDNKAIHDSFNSAEKAVGEFTGQLTTLKNEKTSKEKKAEKAKEIAEEEQKRVDNINLKKTEINAKYQKDKAAWKLKLEGATNELNKAQSHVEGLDQNIATLQLKIDADKEAIDNCHWYEFVYKAYLYVCIGLDYTAIGILWTSEKIASGVLWLCKKTLEAIPSVFAAIESLPAYVSLGVELLELAVDIAEQKFDSEVLEPLEIWGIQATIDLTNALAKGALDDFACFSEMVNSIVEVLEHPDVIAKWALGEICIGALTAAEAVMDGFDYVDKGIINGLCAVITASQQAFDDFFKINMVKFEGELSIFGKKFISLTVDYTLTGTQRSINVTIDFNNLGTVVGSFIEAISHLVTDSGKPVSPFPVTTTYNKIPVGESSKNLADLLPKKITADTKAAESQQKATDVDVSEKSRSVDIEANLETAYDNQQKKINIKKQTISIDKRNYDPPKLNHDLIIDSYGTGHSISHTTSDASHSVVKHVHDYIQPIMDRLQNEALLPENIMTPFLERHQARVAKIGQIASGLHAQRQKFERGLARQLDMRKLRTTNKTEVASENDIHEVQDK